MVEATTLFFWLSALGAMLLLGALTWLRSRQRHDVSIVDSIWSLLFLLAALVWALQASGPRTALVLLLVAFWSLRLSIYITLRHRGKPEDRRYQAIRARNEPGFALKSLWLVFGLQAAIAWVVAVPLGVAIASATALGALDIAGGLLVIAGLLIEAVADAQMGAFRARVDSAGQVMQSGLWRYSRHPNYFGESMIWWGFYLFALSAGGAWSVFSPIIMTLLLLKVSGVTLLEQDMHERRPGYREYVQRTSVFIPWPPRR